jgi:Fic family protein
MAEVDQWTLLDPESFTPSGATVELLGDVDSVVAEIDRSRPIPAHISQAFREELVYDRIYSSAVTEGNRLSRRETIALLEAGVIEAGSRKDVAEVESLGRAVLALDAMLQSKSPLSEGAVRELHSIVTAEDSSAKPGFYRLDEVTISGSTVTPPSAGDVPDLVRQIVSRILEAGSDESPVVIAAWAHWALTRVHPFRDGNGRVARLLQDYVLIDRGYFAIPLFAEDRERAYYEALDAADNGDGRPLIELLAKNALRVGDRLLRALREDEEKRDWLATVTRTAAERVRETEHRRFVRWDRRIAALRLEFQELADELSSTIPEMSIRLRGYEGVDFEKFKALRTRGRAERTWVFGIDVKHGDTRLRFVLWACTHFQRSSDPFERVEDPALLVSMEERPDASGEAAPYYRRLDDLPERIITLRELVVTSEGLERRRVNPVTGKDEWDREVSAGQVARDFYTEMLKRLLLL